ncbi:MAG: two-component regulator propeller domain-containing protein [Bacteroidota bacterium]|nr:two-component regulator propeller domain-containing protein [Bacteroidota bacterium]MDP4197062.1 two-component regulator propeller domain-containing protein [Bacteroidota bacterium]
MHYFAPTDVTSLAADNDFLWIGTSLSLVRFNINTLEKTFFNPLNSGLPSSSIKSVAVDKDGVKWIGTNNGLVRFDGSNWTVYCKSNSGLPDDCVNSISIDSCGNKWIGTRTGGLAKFDGKYWNVYTPPNCKSEFKITATAIDRTGNLWIGAYENGVFKFDGENWIHYTLKNTNFLVSSAAKIVVDKENNIWTASNEGGCIMPFFRKFDGKKWMALDSIPIADKPHNYISRLSANTQGYICVTTFDQIFEYENGKWKLISKRYCDVQSAIIDRNGNKWFTTHDGYLLKYDGKDWSTFSLSNSGLSENGINSLTFDHNNKVWIACGSKGWLFINGVPGSPHPISFDGKSWRVYDTTDCPAFKNEVLSTAVDKNNVIWFGTNGAGLVSYDGKKWETYNKSNAGLPSDYITAIAFDSRGNKWIGTNNGIAVFDGSTWKTYKNSSLFMPDCDILSMAIGKDGIIWMGIGGKGLASFNGRDWSFHTIPSVDLTTCYTISITIDDQNRKWITSSCGKVLICIDGISSKVFYPPALKPYRPTDNKEYPHLNSVAIDKEGNKWLSSSSKFFKFDGNNWTEYSFSDYGLPDVNVRTIAIDSKGNKWICAHYGAGLVIFNENGIDLPLE